MAGGPLRRAEEIVAVGALHVHSDYSHDGLDSLEAIRAFAWHRGIAFLGLTDHAEDFDRSRFDEYVGRCRAVSADGPLLLPGLEFRFSGYPGLHLLALGLTEWIEPATPADFIRQARGRAGFTVVAHPMLAKYRVPDEVCAGVDAIEVWNAAYNTRWLPDPKAIALLQRLRVHRPEVVGIAGLDQHDSSNDRETRVVLHRPDLVDPLAALRAGRFSNRGRSLAFGARPAWGPGRLAVLSGVRWVFDRLERVQDGVARRLSRSRPRGRR
jgi:hypothetical protein